MSERKSYGQTVLEHQEKNLALEDDPREYARSRGKDLWATIKEVADKSSKNELYLNRDFYIVVIHNIERMGGVARDRTFSRRSCPTPTYNQSVFKYNLFADIELLWSIPDMLRYHEILRNKVKYLADKFKRDRAKFVVLMESGELLEWVKKENGEKVDAVIKISKEQT